MKSNHLPDKLPVNLQVMRLIKTAWLLFTTLIILPALAQGGVPIPGETVSSLSAPIPGSEQSLPKATDDMITGNNSGVQLPKPTSKSLKSSSGSEYEKLPLSQTDARLRIDELKNMAKSSRPQDIEEQVHRLCAWLGEIAEAHNKMAVVLGRNEFTKLQSQSEKELASRFSQLKHEAQLLKADLLLKQHRNPEALSPLINIVIAEPLSVTGQTAYKRLKQIGFSEEGLMVPPTKPSAAPAKPTAVPQKPKIQNVIKSAAAKRQLTLRHLRPARR